MQNNLALATEQDNKALQENVDLQNEVVMALRQRLDAQKELLNLSDADIQAEVGSRSISSEKQKDYFNDEYQKSLSEYQNAFENYYKAYRKLLTTNEKGLDDTSILKMEESVSKLSDALTHAKAKLEALTGYAQNKSIDLGKDRESVDKLINSYKTQDSSRYAAEAKVLSDQSSNKIESYNKELAS